MGAIFVDSFQEQWLFWFFFFPVTKPRKKIIKQLQTDDRNARVLKQQISAIQTGRAYFCMKI